MKILISCRNIKLVLGFITICCTQSVSAQAFIPDLNMRQWLNDEIPGIVDVNGIMDTMHVGIAQLDTMNILDINGSGDMVDLEGIQFLDSLRYFHGTLTNFGNNQNVTCNALPAALTFFSIESIGPGTISLPQFPESTDNINLLDLTGWGKTYLIAGLPQNFSYLSVWNCDSISWGDMVHVDHLLIEYSYPNVPGVSSLTIPAISASEFTINGYSPNYFDFSSVVANEVSMFFFGIINEISWPQNLVRLNIDNGLFTDQITPFPNSLEFINIGGSVSGCLPDLPAELDTLIIFSNFNCLPNLPDSLDYFTCSYCMDTNENVRLCSVLNSDCPGSYPGISGTVFADLDQNGIFNTGEPGIPQSSVLVQPIGYLASASSSGYWELGVPPGSYTIAPTSSYPYAQSYSPATHTGNVPNMGDADTLNDFAVTLMPNIQDLRAQLYAEPARPGFDNRLFLHADNYGTMPTVAQLTLNFDADQTWVGSSVAPTSMTGNTAVWDLATLDFAEQVNLTVDLATAASVPLGTPLAHTLTADPVNTDQTPLNNVIFYNDSVVGSFDPNDKLLTPEKLPLSTVQGGYIPLEYTIRFQNTGTYPAERVIIVDTLSEDLQWNSFEFLSSSHPCHWYITDGVLHFIHEGIVLPDSTNDEPNSHGYVKFRIKPSVDLQLGATVTNIAHIVFDFNEPIVTPAAVFTIDELTGVEELSSSGIAVYPNPVEDVLMISLANASLNVTYVIRNVLGQDVLQGRLNGNGQLDVSELHQGQYAIEVITDDAKYVQRFVKN